jgi:hypothetical protein
MRLSYVVFFDSACLLGSNARASKFFWELII